MSERIPDFIELCRSRLAEMWQQVAQRFDVTLTRSPLPEDDELTLAIRTSLTCKTKSYHYVLPTQLLAKVVEPNPGCSCFTDRVRPARRFRCVHAGP